MRLTQKHPSTLNQFSRENVALILVIIEFDLANLPTFAFCEDEDQEKHLKLEVYRDFLLVAIPASFTIGTQSCSAPASGDKPKTPCDQRECILVVG